MEKQNWDEYLRAVLVIISPKKIWREYSWPIPLILLPFISFGTMKALMTIGSWL